MVAGTVEIGPRAEFALSWPRHGRAMFSGAFTATIHPIALKFRE
jgi:hypothetical protein